MKNNYNKIEKTTTKTRLRAWVGCEVVVNNVILYGYKYIVYIYIHKNITFS